MEEAYGTFEDFLVRNDFIYEIAHAWFALMDVCGYVPCASKRSFVAAQFTAETCHHSTLMIKYDDSSIFVLKDRETRSIKVLRICA